MGIYISLKPCDLWQTKANYLPLAASTSRSKRYKGLYIQVVSAARIKTVGQRGGLHMCEDGFHSLQWKDD